jgi:hypothetical protein
VRKLRRANGNDGVDPPWRFLVSPWNQPRAPDVQDGVMGRRGSAVRRVIRFSTLGLLIVGLFVLGGATRAEACSCASVADEEAFANADAGFTGTLVEVITPGDAHSSADPERFVFEVDEVFKGDVAERQSVVTAQEGASCGLEIAGPGPFVVFARTESGGITQGAVEGELYSNLCSGTRPRADGELPIGWAVAVEPSAGSSPIGGDEDGPPLGLIGLGVAGVAVVAVTVTGVAARRRTRPTS